MAQRLRLSSPWTKFNLFLAMGACLFIVPIAGYLVVMENGIHWGLLPAGLIVLFAFFLLFSMLHAVCDAYIIDGRLVLKKVFGPAKEYQPSDPLAWEVAHMRRTTIIHVEAGNEGEDDHAFYTIIQARHGGVDVKAALEEWKGGA